MDLELPRGRLGGILAVAETFVVLRSEGNIIV